MPSSAAVLSRLIVTLLSLDQLDVESLLTELDSYSDPEVTHGAVQCIRGWMFYLKGDLDHAEHWYISDREILYRLLNRCRIFTDLIFYLFDYYTWLANQLMFVCCLFETVLIFSQLV